MGRRPAISRGAKKKVKINFNPVEGEILDAIAKAIEPQVNAVLAKHGASLRISVKEILRNHAKG
ncbi:hypothetical protein GCM10010911_04600 [Paenibacillus nasutitermitis]|uniref:Uncharacterized protein n=2 Tax=Paenibacillus nasutitermitis TaxID=1652958 RepID=A0A916YLZ5_9BACL|nr:hypothetical protein GCM10010911_04600 [Paenibacillus nasutitermitis]